MAFIMPIFADKPVNPGGKGEIISLIARSSGMGNMVKDFIKVTPITMSSFQHQLKVIAEG